MSEHAGPRRGLTDIELRVRALESILTEKGLVERAALDAIVEQYETRIGPRNGAAVVARAWTDPAYKTRLMTDATAAIAELGYRGLQGENMVVVENTATVHRRSGYSSERTCWKSGRTNGSCRSRKEKTRSEEVHTRAVSLQCASRCR